MNNDRLEVVKFEATKSPIPYESREVNDTKPVTYGTNNLYPEYLLKLFNECGIHAAIVENKSNYIIGDGLKYDNGADVDFKANASDNVKELVSKLVKDYLIFNYFAVEVVFNVFGEPIEYHHVPAHKIRTNKSKTKFWFNEDWSYSKKSIQYDRWNMKDQDATSKIFFFDGYFPSTSNVYTRPEYYAAIESIETDIATKAFNKNNIKNHFSPSHIITFYEGANVPEETRRQILQTIKASYTGENGNKVILDFQNAQGGKSADVKQLSSGDWAEAYINTENSTINSILSGHQIVSPMLFGIKTEGQLGGATELETQFQVFKNTYVKVKRDTLESAFNLLFSQSKELKGKVKFGDTPLFPPQVSENVKTQVMTINEIRKEMGLGPIQGGDRLLSEPAPSTPAPAPVSEAPVQQEAEDGDNLSDNEVKKKSSSKKLTEEDYELIKDLGSHADEFDIIGEHMEAFKFSVEQDVAKYVIENDIRLLTLDELNALLKKDVGVNVAANELKGILDDLNESGVVKVSYDDKGRVEVKPSKVADVPDSDAVSVMYKYIKRPNVSGGDLLPTSRSFCTKLINNNRLYTKEEIQQMSGLFGYDVYQYAGGFYYNPDKDETTPYCRHTWQALKVKRRQK